MIDECSRRREDFDEESVAWVRLADGQEWAFSKPYLSLRPVFRDGKAIAQTRCLTQGRDLDRLIEAIRDGEDWLAKVLAIQTLGAFLLRRSYESLADEELFELLAYEPGNPDSDSMIRAIFSVATGHDAPKHSPAGAS